MPHSSPHGNADEGRRRRTPRDEDVAHSHQSLDPLGIYGTRTELRRLDARRQRLAQQLIALFALAGLLCALLIFARRPHAPVLKGTRVAWAQTPGASPVFAEDSRAVRLLLPSQGGDLQSFDPANGNLVTLLDVGFPLRATPLVVRNVAFVPCEDGSLYAVDWRTARTLWQHQAGASLSARPAFVEVKLPMHPPLLAGVREKFVVIGNDAGLIQCLQAGSGDVVWQRGAGAPVGSGIVAVPDRKNQTPRVLVPLLDGTASRGGLWCLDALSGSLLWKFPREAKAPAPQLAPPALDAAGERAFCGDDTGALTCLRLRDGARLWKTYARPRPNSRESVLLRGEPLFQRDGSGERVIVGANDGFVRAFNAADGHLLWSYDAGAPVRGLPLSLQNDGHPAVLIGCDSPQMWLLDAQTGALLREFRTDGNASFAALSWNNALYAATTRGSLEKFRF